MAREAKGPMELRAEVSAIVVSDGGGWERGYGLGKGASYPIGVNTNPYPP